MQCCSHFGYVTNIVKFLLNYIFLSELDLRPCSPWDLIEAETTATGYYQPELIIDEVYVGVFSNIIIPLNYILKPSLNGTFQDSTDFCHRNCREKVIRYKTTTSSTVRRALDVMMNYSQGTFSK